VRYMLLICGDDEAHREMEADAAFQASCHAWADELRRRGVPVSLGEQDRSRWDGSQIDEGVRLLEAALRRGRPGPYQVQAAIAACHSTAREAAETDWAQIAALYRPGRPRAPGQAAGGGLRGAQLRPPGTR
jgi:predicted RNA polymerase sigma factor